MRNGFVETQFGSDLFLQLGMGVDVVPPEWLLNHQQVEVVEATQEFEVVQRVCGVCVDGKQDIGMCLANGGDVGTVLAGFDLNFDSLIAGCKFGGNFFQKLFWRSLQAERNTARDFLLRATE